MVVVPSERHEAVRAARRLTAWLTGDLPVSAALRAGLSDHGFDHSGSLLLAWREAETGVFEGALVDALDGPFECRFRWDPDAQLGNVEEVSRVSVGATEVRFDWTQMMATAIALRRRIAESPAQRELRLSAFEERHGVRLPDDYRGFMVDHDGWLGWTGSGDWLEIVSIDELEEWNLVPQTKTHPGLVLIGCDGSRELVGFDNRQQPAPVVLVQITSSGWEDAVVQAPSFSEFRVQLDQSGYRFE